MPGQLDELDRMLTPHYNPDFWSDNVKTEAGTLLDGLQDDEWDSLLSIWPSKPASWCIRLSEASLLSEKPRVIQLLVAVLKRPEAQVGSAVAAMLLEKGYQWSPDESLLADLQRHLDQYEWEQKPIRMLMSRLPS